MDLLNLANRKMFLEDIKSDENITRKEESLKAFEVYNDRIEKYVREYLLEQYSEKTLLQYVIVSTINLAKRIATKEASLYKECPDREFKNLTEEQEDELENLYKQIGVDSELFKANVYYKLQSQSFIKIVPKNGSLELKVILPHHIDAVPGIDPEVADAYVLNSFDKSRYVLSDSVNQLSADRDDYKASLERYITWTKEANFVFNGKGETIGEVVENPIKELPFVDVSGSKDFEFFVRCGQPLIDFTIQYNGALSDLQQLIKMQAFGQAVIKGDPKLMPKELTVGVSKIIHLPVDPNNPVQTDFEFKSASPDVSGSIQAVENLLSNFLSSRGLDPKLINGKAEASKFSSGIDRLLSMISDIEASKQDIEIFKLVEKEVFNLIKLWSNATFGTDQQFLSFAIPEDAEVEVKYYEPTMIQSEQEKIANLQAKKELGLASQKMIIAEYYNISEQEAAEKMDEINSDILMPQVSDVTEA